MFCPLVGWKWRTLTWCLRWLLFNCLVVQILFLLRKVSREQWWFSCGWSSLRTSAQRNKFRIRMWRLKDFCATFHTESAWYWYLGSAMSSSHTAMMYRVPPQPFNFRVFVSKACPHAGLNVFPIGGSTRWNHICQPESSEDGQVVDKIYIMSVAGRVHGSTTKYTWEWESQS